MSSALYHSILSDPRFDATLDMRARYNYHKRNRPMPQGSPEAGEKAYLVFDARRGAAYDGNVVYVYATSKADAIAKACALIVGSVPAKYLVATGTWKIKSGYKPAKKKFKRSSRAYGRR